MEICEGKEKERDCCAAKADLALPVFLIRSDWPTGLTIPSVKGGGVRECQLTRKLILTVCAAYKGGVLFQLSHVDTESVTLEH